MEKDLIFFTFSSGTRYGRTYIFLLCKDVKRFIYLLFCYYMRSYYFENNYIEYCLIVFG